MPNKNIVVAAFVITAAGIVNSITNKTKVTPVVIGGYIFLLVLSLVDMVGGDVAKIASGLAMLAMVYVLLNVFPWGIVLKTLKGNTK